MRKLFCLFLVFCMLYHVSIFAENTENMTWHNITLTPSKYSENDFDKSDVIFRTEFDAYSNNIENINYIFKNNTDMSVSFGDDAELEVFLNEKWYQIPLLRDIDDIAYTLNKSAEGSFRWNVEKYDLPEGTYRIIKECNDLKYGQLGDFGRKKYYAVFEIKKYEDLPNNITWNNMQLEASQYTENDFDRSKKIILHTEHDVYGKDIEKIAYIFENHTDSKITYGYENELEVFLNGKWYQIPLHRFIEHVAMILNPNQKRGEVFYWDAEQYHLPEGKYRIIKQAETLENTKKYCAEFYIGGSNYTKNTPFAFTVLQELPQEYTIKWAISNDDVVLEEDGIAENTENIKKFIENISLNIPAFLRTTRYLKNGDIIITDVEYRFSTESGQYEFYYTFDSTRTKNNIGITTKVYTDIITEGNNIYLSDGKQKQYLFSKSNEQSAFEQIKQMKK